MSALATIRSRAVASFRLDLLPNDIEPHAFPRRRSAHLERLSRRSLRADDAISEQRRDDPAALATRHGQLARSGASPDTLRFHRAAADGQSRTDSRQRLGHQDVQVLGHRRAPRAVWYLARMEAWRVAHRPRWAANPVPRGNDARVESGDEGRPRLRGSDRPSQVQGQHGVREVAAAGSRQNRDALTRVANLSPERGLVSLVDACVDGALGYLD